MMTAMVDVLAVLAGLPDLPACGACGRGVLLPLSDYGPEGGALIAFKAWACSTPACGFSVRIDKGSTAYGKPIRAGER